MGLIDNVNVNVGGNGNIIDTLSTYVTKLLKPNIVDGKNVLTQDMMSAANTKYVIKYDYTLAEDITVPANCVLEFDGGSVSASGGNNNIACNNTYINAGTTVFNNIVIEGTLANDTIYAKWFNSNNVIDGLLNVFKFAGKTVVLENKTYQYDYRSISLLSHTVIEGNGAVLHINNTGSSNYEIVNISNIDDVVVKNLHIVGDLVENDVAGEHGHGFNIQSSTNIKLINCSSAECCGDGLYIGRATNGTVGDNIQVVNSVFDSNKRQGISVVCGINLLIDNCECVNTGSVRYTAPGAGLDFEPNDREGNDIIICIVKNCIFKGNYNSNDLAFAAILGDSYLLFENCVVEGNISGYISTPDNIRFDNVSCNDFFVDNCQNIEIDNSKIAQFRVWTTRTGHIIPSKNIIVRNSVISTKENYFRMIQLNKSNSSIEDLRFENTKFIFNTVVADSQILTLNGVASVNDVKNVIFNCCDFVCKNVGHTTLYVPGGQYYNCNFTTTGEVFLKGKIDKNDIINCNIVCDKIRIGAFTIADKLSFLRNIVSCGSADFILKGSGYIDGDNELTVVYGFNYFPNGGYIGSAYKDFLNRFKFQLIETTPYSLDYTNYASTRVGSVGRLVLSDNTFKKVIQKLDNYVVDANGFIPNKNSGDTRPTNLDGTIYSVGYCFFDTNINKPIWWTGDTTSGKSGWVDATGATV